MPSKRQHAPSAGSAQPAAKRRKVAKPEKVTSRVHWNEDLTWDLVHGIADNVDIRVGLFLGPQSHPLYPNDPRGTRTDWFMELADIIFSDHPRYGPAYAEEVDPEKWATKVLYRFDKLVPEVRKHMRDMEKGGPGITSKNEIDFSRDTPFITLARNVLAECPWYFEIKAILDEARGGPPGGFPVGNSRTPIDENVLLRSTRCVNTGQRHEDLDDSDEAEDSDRGSDDSDSDEDDFAQRELQRRYEEAKRKSRAYDEKLRQLEVERASIRAKAELKLQRQRVRYMVREAKLRYDLDLQLHKERRAALGAVYKMHPYQPHPEVEYLVPPVFVDPSLAMRQRGLAQA